MGVTRSPGPKLLPPQRTGGVLAALLSGALMAACYWPLSWHFLAWVALVPWLIVLPHVSAERAWSYGALVGLVFYGIGLAWMCQLAGPVGIAVVAGLSVWMGLAFRVAKLLMDRFGDRAMVWVVPLAFVGQEVLRSEGLPQWRFAYLGWGYSQSHNLWIAQIASIGGVYCVSFLLVTFSAALAYALLHQRRRSFVVPAVIAGVIVLLGWVTQPSSDSPGREVGVACVQAETIEYEEYLTLTAQAVNCPEKPVFVVLPEHSIYDNANERHPMVKGLADLAREHGAYVCVGAHVRAPRGAACDYDNVGLLIGPDGRIVARQAKAVPVPFFQDGNPARSQDTVATPWGRIGTYICYDATFTDIPRRLVDLGAELLLAPLMDPEPWPVQQRWQHADMAPFRSIELRRWAVRAASSGVSQVVGSDGRVHEQRTREEGPGVICAGAYFDDERTLFVQGGHLFATGVATAYLIIVLWLTVVDWTAKLRRRTSSVSPPAALRAEPRSPTH